MSGMWDWRKSLTPTERTVVERHEAAQAALQDAIKAARKHADKTRIEYDRVRNRALQRAKYAKMVEVTTGRSVTPRSQEPPK